MLLFTKQSDSGKTAEISGKLSKASAGRAPGVGLGPDSRPRQASLPGELGHRSEPQKGAKGTRSKPLKGLLKSFIKVLCQLSSNEYSIKESENSKISLTGPSPAVLHLQRGRQACVRRRHCSNPHPAVLDSVQPGLCTAWPVPRTVYMYTRVQGQRLSFVRDPRPVCPKLSEKELNCFPSSRTHYYSHSRGREGAGRAADALLNGF